MNRGFWDTLPKPFFVLAPMYDVTDVAFRHVVSRCGPPDVYFTEFVSTDGLSNHVGRERLMHHLLKEESGTPLVAQVFGAKPEKFFETAKLIHKLGFNGIDLNTGCPDKNIIKSGSCAALYKTPTLAKEILLAMKEGAGNMPVSVKIRIGDTKIDWENWIATLLEAKPAAISIHLRTRKEMSKVPAHWEEMPNIVKFIHANTTPENRPLIVGNGDVQTTNEGRAKTEESNCDGVMIGRGVFQDPWVFSKEHREHTTREKAALLLLHAEQYEKYFSGTKPFEPLKRFYKIYINGFEGAAELREELYTATTAAGVKAILSRHQLL
jgi:tRNA-dihydrouridine synthase